MMVVDLNGKKRKERNELIKQALEELGEEVDNIPKGLQRFSLRNIRIILTQDPKATDVRGYKDWKESGRKPKGSGIAIFFLAPTFKKNEDEEDELRGFIWVSGWDIKNTIPVVD
jgi:hypothetical protein